jgi:hypothetical protein
MLGFLQRHRLFASVIGGIVLTPTLLFALVLTYHFAGVRLARCTGHFLAHLDVQRGHYRELGYGFALPWRETYSATLHSRYPEAESVAVAGCIVSPQLESYVRAYNEVSANAARAHFGTDIFAETSKHAEAAYISDHPAHP